MIATWQNHDAVIFHTVTRLSKKPTPFQSSLQWNRSAHCRRQGSRRVERPAPWETFVWSFELRVSFPVVSTLFLKNCSIYAATSWCKQIWSTIWYYLLKYIQTDYMIDMYVNVCIGKSLNAYTKLTRVPSRIDTYNVFVAFLSLVFFSIKNRTIWCNMPCVFSRAQEWSFRFEVKRLDFSVLKVSISQDFLSWSGKAKNLDGYHTVAYSIRLIYCILI